VFRDELPDLLHGNEDAKRLQRQTYLLSEFLEKAAHYNPPKLKRKALVHGHCHHKSTLGFESEEQVLAATGLQYQVLDSGCCGMAGAFGYERDHYEVGIKCGERVLLPAVRNAPPDSLIIADGFSCREQISQQTDGKPLHLAQVLQMALHDGPFGSESKAPEQEYASTEKTETMLIGATAGLVMLASGGMWWALHRRNDGPFPRK
jgi:Fe-S oxidoreductase